MSGAMQPDAAGGLIQMLNEAWRRNGARQFDWSGTIRAARWDYVRQTFVPLDADEDGQ